MAEPIVLAVDADREAHRAATRRRLVDGLEPPREYPEDDVLTLDRIHFRVSGMVSRSDALRLQRRLSRVEGVDEARVSFDDESAVVSVLEYRIDVPFLRVVIESAGFNAYHLAEVEKTPEELREATHRERGRTAVRTVLPGLVLIATAVLVRDVGLGAPGVRSLLADAQLYMAVAVLWFGRRLFLDAARLFGWQSAAREVPLGLAAAIAFSASLWAFFSQGEPMFDVVAVIVSGYHVGAWFESWLRRRAERHFTHLVALRPRWATTRRRGRDVRMAIRDLDLEDPIFVNPGEVVPVDGVVVGEGGVVDESVLMGAGSHVQKQNGDRVYAGTLSVTSRFQVASDSMGDDSVLGHLLRVLEDARETRAPVQRRFDRLAALLSPVTLALAIATFVYWRLEGPGEVVWFALAPALSVLVITTPWALGFASAVPVTAAMTVAARRGVLTRDAGVLERIRDLDVMVFRKAGTLTTARPEVETIDLFNGADLRESLCLLIAVEKNATHHAATAFVRVAEERFGDAFQPPDATIVRGFRSIPSRGLIAHVDGREVVVGAATLLVDKGIDVPAEPELPGAFRYLAVGGVLWARALLYDPMREDSIPTVARVKREGIRPILVTAVGVAESLKVASTVGIIESDVRSNIDPAEQAEVVRVFRAAGVSVGVVGSRDADRAALAVSDVAFALIPDGRLPRERHAVSLLRPGAGGVITALDLSARAFRLLRQNLWVGATLMMGGIPAALGYLPPHGAVLGMLLTMLAVGVNGLRGSGMPGRARTDERTGKTRG